MEKIILQTKRQIVLFIIILLTFINLNAFSQTQVELNFQSRLPFIEDVDDLEIYNSRLYIKLKNDIMIGDILEDFSAQIHLDYLAINDIIDLCNQDSILLVTTDQGLITFRLTDTTLPKEIGRIEQDKLYSIFKCEDNIYVVYNKNQLFKLNLENPHTPSFIKNSIIFENTNITWIEGFEDILYIATSDSGIFSLDITNFLNPIIISRINSDLTYKKLLRNDDILIALFEDILTNWEFGNEKYDSGIIMYTLSESSIPSKISEYRISPGGGVDIALSNPHLYFLSGHYSLGDLVYTTNCIYSFDLINPTTPVLLDSLSIEAYKYNNNFYWPQMMVWDSDHLWIAQWDGIVQVNTANPNSLIQSREIDYGGFARNIDADSIYIAVTDDYFGLHILDCSIPESPTLIASFSEITDGGDAKIRDGFVYATSRAGGFRIYDLKEIPHEISHLILPGSGFKIFLKDTLAFIGDGPAGLTIINIKDTMTPNIIGRLELEDRTIYNVQVQGNYAYVTYDRFDIQGFGIIDVSNPSNPTPIYASPIFANYVKGLFVDKNRLYIQGDYTEIKVYNITEPTNPELLTQIEMGTFGNWDIFVENNLLYSIRGGIYDISDLMNPTKLCDMPETSMGMVKSDQYFYIARGFLGIYSYFLDITSDIKIQNSMKLNSFDLSQNYPNPFNESTMIKFFLPKVSNVTLKIYNLLGEEVETLINKELPIGEHNLTWNSKNFVSGLYFYQLKTEEFIETKKLLIQK